LSRRALSARAKVLLPLKFFFFQAEDGIRDPVDPEPVRRFEAIDVTKRVEAEAGDILLRMKAFTLCPQTAAISPPSFSARLHHQATGSIFFTA
jgi:hypothetical protein